MDLLTSSPGAQRLCGFLNYRKGRLTARPWQNNYNHNGVSPAWCDWTSLFSYLLLACSYPLYQNLGFPLLFSICHTPRNPASSVNFVQWWSEHKFLTANTNTRKYNTCPCLTSNRNYHPNCQNALASNCQQYLLWSPNTYQGRVLPVDGLQLHSDLKFLRHWSVVTAARERPKETQDTKQD